MLGDSAYSFGCQWMKQGLRQIGDMWDARRRDWCTIEELSSMAGARKIEERRDRIIAAIPTEWCLISNIEIEKGEWVAGCTTMGFIDTMFQCVGEGKETILRKKQQGLLTRAKEDPIVEFPDVQMHRIRVATTCGDL